jgi:hypothetical protein
MFAGPQLRAWPAIAGSSIPLRLTSMHRRARKILKGQIRLLEALHFSQFEDPEGIAQSQMIAVWDLAEGGERA